VLSVSQSFYPHAGGVSYYLLWLGRRLHELGHELTILHLRSLTAPAEEVVETLKVFGGFPGRRRPRRTISVRSMELGEARG